MVRNANANKFSLRPYTKQRREIPNFTELYGGKNDFSQDIGCSQAELSE
jgi:hypothetical protein